MYNFTKIIKKILTSQTPDTDHSAQRLYVIPNVEVDHNLTETTTNRNEIISNLTINPSPNKVDILSTLTKLKELYDIDTPKNVTDELQPTNSEPNQQNLSKETNTWIQELQNEMIVTLTQIKDAPKIANIMRCKTEPTPELTSDFQSILSRIQTTEELRAALRRCQAGKCGGPSGITREHLLYLPDDVLEHFIAPINSIIDGTCTDKYKLGAIVPLLKDERRYRPVTLLETLWKTAMTRISDRLLDVLHKHKLLHPTQYAFIRGGNTHAPLDIMAHAMQRSKAKKTETHVCFLDATSAYDCVPLWSLDIAFRRLGAPEDFTTWIRKTTAGHERIVATCAGTTKDSFPLGGLAQGCPFSPALWVVLADMALCHAYQTPESDAPEATANPTTDGVTLAEAGETPNRDERISVKALGYADDLSAIGKSNPETQKYAQAMVTMLGCLNIRVQGSKCIYLRPAIAANNDETCELTSELLTMMGITSHNQETLTLENIDKTSLLNKK